MKYEPFSFEGPFSLLHSVLEETGLPNHQGQILPIAS